MPREARLLLNDGKPLRVHNLGGDLRAGTVGFCLTSRLLLPVSAVAGVQAADRLFRRRPAVAASAVREEWVSPTGSGLRPG